MRRTLIVLTLLALAAPAAAQDVDPGGADGPLVAVEPATPAVPAFEPGLMLAYNLADLESADPLTGFSLEVDVGFEGVPVSFVGHVSRSEPAEFNGAGLRISHDVGPFELFGHYLFGRATLGGDPADGISQKRGGGANVPLGDGLFLRMGADHHADILHSVIGLGYTW